MPSDKDELREALQALTERVNKMQAEIDRLTTLTRHITPECPECGMRAIRSELHGAWLEAHTMGCSRGQKLVAAAELARERRREP